MKAFVMPLLFAFCGSISAQNTFNVRLHFGQPFSNLTSVFPTDSCYYATGVISDTTNALFKIGNVFVKFDLNGDTVFTKKLLNPLKFYQTWAGDMIESPDNNLIDIGQTSDSLLKAIILKFDTNGDTILSKEYLSPYYPQSDFILPFQMIYKEDGSSVILNDVERPNGDNNLSLAFFDNQLNLIAHKTYGDQYDEIPGTMILDDDGGLIIGCNRDNTNFVSHNFWSKAYIFKTDSIGNLIWEYLTPANIITDRAYGMAKSSDGGMIVATSRGFEHPINTDNGQIRWESAYFFKLDENHQKAWDLEVFDSIRPGPGQGITRMITVDSGEAYVAAGYYNMVRSLDPLEGGTYGWFFKFTGDGQLKWIRKHQILIAVGHLHEVYDLKAAPDGGFVIVGKAQSGINGTEPPAQAWLLKLDSFGCLVPGCQWQDTLSTAAAQPAEPTIELAIYPNPTSDYLNFQLRTQQAVQRASFRIINAEGRIMKEFASEYATDTFIVPVWEWGAGVYFLQYIHEGEVRVSERFVITR